MKRYGTFHQLVYHFVWATKYRQSLLTSDVESMLLPYISLKCIEHGYRLHAVNGAMDHLHVLLELTPAMLVADVAKNLKGSSSHYINHESGLSKVLYWQDGYSVITIRVAEVAKVSAYIKNQKEHHRLGTLSEVLERIEP